MTFPFNPGPPIPTTVWEALQKAEDAANAASGTTILPSHPGQLVKDKFLAVPVTWETPFAKITRELSYRAAQSLDRIKHPVQGSLFAPEKDYVRTGEPIYAKYEDFL
jgi:hypothetical protein